PKIPSDLEKILMKALTKDLALRYNDAGVFHRSLQGFLGKHYNGFTQKEVSEILQKVFADDIENEKKRFEQLYRQSIPFSQGETKEGVSNEFDQIEDALDGSITKSENGPATAVTFIGEEDEAARPRSGDWALEQSGEKNDQSEKESNPSA